MPRAEAARADAQEGDAVVMARIHVGLDLEHEAGKRRLVRLHRAGLRGARQRRRRQAKEGVQQ